MNKTIVKDREVFYDYELLPSLKSISITWCIVPGNHHSFIVEVPSSPGFVDPTLLLRDSNFTAWVESLVEMKASRFIKRKKDCKKIIDSYFFEQSLIPEKIIFHDPATIVFWRDGTKTVVKCMEGQPYSRYYGFVSALAKKIYGTNSEIERIVRSGKE